MGHVGVHDYSLGIWHLAVLLYVLRWCAKLHIWTTLKKRLTSLGTPDTLEIVGRFMISAVVCRAIVAYELAGQKIAAKKFTSDEPETQPIRPEHFEATPPHHQPATETYNKSNSSLPRLASPDDDPRTSESEGRSSFALRSLHEQNMTSAETTEGIISMPSTDVVSNSFALEGGERRVLSEVGRSSTLSNITPEAGRTPINMHRVRTEEV
jgi:hypothetical protein